jgi:hypothetical protein
MLHDARKVVIGAQQDEREALIIAQQDIVRRAKPLDQLRFQKQRLGLGIGRHDGHAAALRHHPLQAQRQPLDLRVIGHAVAQGPRLADIQDIAPHIGHPIDAGPRG